MAARTRARSSSPTPQTATYADRTGADESGSERASERESPTSEATTSATAAPPSSSTRAYAERGRRAPRPQRSRLHRTTYAHVMRDASRRRRIPITEALRRARAVASPRPLVDPSRSEPENRPNRPDEKSLQIERADARIRTVDQLFFKPFGRVAGPSGETQRFSKVPLNRVGSSLRRIGLFCRFAADPLRRTWTVVALCPRSVRQATDPRGEKRRAWLKTS